MCPISSNSAILDVVDPFIAGQYAAHMVQGMQEQDEQGRPKVLAYPKHFTADRTIAIFPCPIYSTCTCHNMKWPWWRATPLVSCVHTTPSTAFLPVPTTFLSIKFCRNAEINPMQHM
jgi:hypothetical protein